MKITDVETIVIKNIQPYRGGRYWLFVQLITDEGIIGLGERPSGNATNLDSQISLIKNLCQQFAIGTSPFDIESLWQRIFASRHDYRHPGLDATPALSAIEMASGTDAPTFQPWTRSICYRDCQKPPGGARQMQTPRYTASQMHSSPITKRMQNATNRTPINSRPPYKHSPCYTKPCPGDLQHRTRGDSDGATKRSGNAA